ncbi:MAG TPA: hypothetical protein VM053_08015 [Gemmatimonadaceae bacterium]|nr:hypothetical protein [Gemmatimonadaceae bacterium]
MTRSIVVALAALCTGIGLFACTDVSGNSGSVLSIQFDSLAAPSVVVGDTLRDTTGVAIRPVVHAFDFDGNEITSPTIRFQSPDSGVKVDSVSGFITADSLRSTQARIYATVGSLQAVQRLDVTLRPDSIAAVNEVDSLLYSPTDTVSPQLKVKLTHGKAPNDSAVKSYIVSYAIIAQKHPQLGELVNDAVRASRVDTTGTDGVAGRAIRLHPLNIVVARDTILVDATAKYRGVPVAGSPVRFILILKPRA